MLRDHRLHVSDDELRSAEKRVITAGNSCGHRRTVQPKAIAEPFFTKPFWIAIALSTRLSSLTPVRAQHAADDPVASANDAFGLTLGLESIGMYSPGGVRGFNPQTAGNVRIDGLYFDQQGALSSRSVDGSTISIDVRFCSVSKRSPILHLAYQN